MSFLDKLKKGMEKGAEALQDMAEDIADGVNDGLNGASCEKVVLSDIPTDLEAFKAMDGMDFKDPNKVVALTVAALCVYPADKQTSIDMLNHLKGPRPLSAYEMSFLADRFRGKDYLAASYLDGATYKNNYEPSSPYTVSVYKTSHSEAQFGEGYLQLYLKSGGADSARGVKLRKKESTNQWFLWEYFLLPDIRKPIEQDPWA